MKQGDYSLNVQILEANELRPLKSKGIFGFGGSQEGSVTATVVVQTEGKQKKTKQMPDELNPKWNQTIIINLPKMKKQQLQEGSVKFSIIDTQSSRFGTVLGVYQIDFTQIYFSYQHELYRTWLTLSDPSGDNQGQCMGYLLIDVSLLGPEDQPPVHDLNQQKNPGASQQAVMVPRQIPQTGHQISVIIAYLIQSLTIILYFIEIQKQPKIDLYRGEHFAPLDSTGPENDAYLLASFSGSKVTSSVNTSRNPEWNEELKIGCMLPTNTKYIICSIYDYDFGASDDLLGTFKIPFSEIKEKEALAPKWVNLYGSALLVQNQHADLMNLHGDTQGSHYRGRILYKATSRYNHEPKSMRKKLEFSFPERPIPSAPQKSYILRIDLMEALQLPGREQCIFHITLGPYMVHSEAVPIVNGRAIIYQSLLDKRVFMPVEVDQIPDLIFYFCDQNEGQRRHSFYRMPAKNALCADQIRYTETHKPQVIQLKQDRALDLVKDDEFPGFLYARVQLLSIRPPPREIVTKDQVKQVKFQLRIFLYVGRGIPPSDECGTSDPFCQIRCAGKNGFSSIKYGTCNPGWYETICMDVELPPFDGTSLIPAGMFIMVFDSDIPQPKKADDPKAEPQPDVIVNPETIEKQDLIGRIWVTMDPVKQKFKNPEAGLPPLQILYRKPQWYNIVYDVTDEAAGQVLLSYSLVKDQDKEKIPIEPRMYPRVNKTVLHIFVIGLRDIDDDKDNPKIQKGEIGFDVSGDENDPVKEETQKDTFNVNQHIKFDLDVPRNKNFSPVIDIFAWDITQKSENQGKDYQPPLLGYGVINLSQELQIYQPPPQEGEEVPPDSDDEEENFLLEGKFDGPEPPPETPADLAQLKDTKDEDEFEKFNPEDLVIPWEMPKQFKIVDDKTQRDFDENLSKSKTRRKLRKNEIQSDIKKELGQNYVIREQNQDDDEGELQQKRQNGISEGNQLIESRYANEGEIQQLSPPQQSSGKQHPLIDYSNDPNHLENVEIQFQIEIENSNPPQQVQNEQNDQEHHASEPQRLNLKQPPKVMTRQPQEPYEDSKSSVSQSSKNDIGKKSQKSKQNDEVIQSLYNDIDEFICEEEGGKFQEPIYKSINVRNQKPQSDHISELPVQENKRSYQLDDPENPSIINNPNANTINIENGIERKPFQPLTLLNNENDYLNNDAAIQRSVVKEASVSSQPLSNFHVATNLSFSKATKVSSHALSVRGLVKADNVADPQKGKQKQKKSKKDKKSVFSIFKKKDPELDIETYEDYDTDEGEDLDTTPEFMRDRDRLKDDIQDILSQNKKLQKFAMKKGQLRGGNGTLFSNQKPPEPTISCYLKCIFLEETPQMTKELIEKKMAQYQESLQPRQYICRIYVLDGINIMADGTPDLYLKFCYQHQIIDLKNSSLCKATLNPQFYYMQEFKLMVPGNVFIELQIWKDDDGDEELVGQSKIDIEDRYFNKDWNTKYTGKQPVEARNLLPDIGSNSVGRINCWIELIDKNQLKNNLPVAIYPPPQHEFELRVIIWETRWCVFKDEVEGCNDLFVKAKVGNSEWQETDTHWRCRAKGSFNWRMKWDVKYQFPPSPDDYGKDKLKIQMWDRDVVASNDLIGETEIDLNQHKLIQKAIQRKASTQMMMRIIEKRGCQSDRLWYDVYHPLFQDDADRPISQGQFRISIELVPQQMAAQKPNGFGRDAPNIMPFLEEPTGRLQFDLMNPLAFIKDIIGPDLYNQICGTILCVLCTVIFCAVGWLLLSQVFAVSIAS